MNNKFGKDLTEGSIPRNLIKFALPILVGNILTTGYSIINAVWVGKLLGGNAVGAVAVSFPVFLAMMALASGTTMATSILVSQHYGAKDYNAIQKIVNVSWFLGGLVVIMVTVLGLIFSDSILGLLGTPTEILSLASSYLKISLAGFVFMYLSFLIVSILRGIGDTMTPMAFIVISTGINAALDPLLIMGIGPFPHLGLNGAAVASLSASIFTTVGGLAYVLRKYKGLPINPTAFVFDKTIAMSILKIGLPSFAQQMILSFSYAFITSFVNMFGADAIAAFGIASRIDSIVAMPAMAIMIGAATLTAQSLGAGKPEKIKSIFRWGIVVNIPVTLLISLTCIMVPEAIMRIFVNNAAVIEIGVGYFRIVGFAYLFFIVTYVSNGIINGSGKTIITMLISFTSLCIMRIPITMILVKTSLGLKGVWTAAIFSTALTTTISLLYYFSGRWNKSVIKEKEIVNGELITD
ncbi:MAG: MATE family efflux transporter [Clostridia bacterium]|nr:MATE family efflux transporter [Clostridia bacterium]